MDLGVGAREEGGSHCLWMLATSMYLKELRGSGLVGGKWSQEPPSPKMPQNIVFSMTDRCGGQ